MVATETATVFREGGFELEARATLSKPQAGGLTVKRKLVEESKDLVGCMRTAWVGVGTL